MGEGLQIAGMLLGGLGLFLLAVGMISDGLRLAAGSALRELLGRWTSTPARGIASGIAITAIVQSSSAVTVATIGFVNAGLLSLYQALGVVYGANIGTTVTGWLVAAVGFKIKVEAFAIPLVGLGMLLRMTGTDSRRAPIGLAIAGFGLFFIGIDVLREAFEGMANTIDLQQYAAEGISGILLFVLIGFMMTVLTQSSSAAIAITLTAATGGMVGLHAAAAMVIGANVGTTSTAAFSVIGATANAKRVAAAHIVFNIVTALVALLLLPMMFWAVDVTGNVLGMEDIPAVTLALFHTLFNILGVLLMWPFTEKLAGVLSRLFVTQEEVEGRPKFIDKTVAVSPPLALNALGLEVAHLGSVARRMSIAVMSMEGGVGKSLRSDHDAAQRLGQAIGDFTAHLQRSALSEEIARELPVVLGISQRYLTVANLALEIASLHEEVGVVEEAELAADLTRLRTLAVRLLDLTDIQQDRFSTSECDAVLEELASCYRDLKLKLLEPGTAAHMGIRSISAVIEQNGHIRRLARQMVRASHALSEVIVVAQGNRVSAVEPHAQAA